MSLPEHMGQSGSRKEIGSTELWLRLSIVRLSREARRCAGFGRIVAWDAWRALRSQRPRGRLEKIVLWTAVCVQIAYVAVVPIVHSGDSFGYLYTALDFLDGNNGFHLMRPPGYPLLVILSGFGLTLSLIPLLLIQSLMAVHVPLLCYRTVRPFGRRAAFVAGMAVSLTLIASSMSTAIMSEHVSMYFMVLGFWASSRITVRTNKRWVFIALAAFLASTFMRASGQIFLIVPIFAYFLRGGRNWRVYAYALLMCFSVLFAWNVARTAIINLPVAKTIIGIPSPTLFTGKMLFYSVYHISQIVHPQFTLGEMERMALTEKDFQPKGKFSPDNGPRSAEVWAALGEHYRTNPLLRERFATLDDYLAYYAVPSHPKWGTLLQSLDAVLGPVESEKLLMRASLETIGTHPEILVGMMYSSLMFLVGPPFHVFHEDKMIIDRPGLYVIQNLPDTWFPERAGREQDFRIVFDNFPGFVDGLTVAWGWFVVVAKPLAFFFVVATLIPMARSRFRVIPISMFATLVLTAAATGVFGGTVEQRYVYAALPLFLILVVIGWASMTEEDSWRG